MYKSICKYLTENSLLYKKQIGFQSSHSTDRAITQLVDQVLQSFVNHYFTLRTFLDLPKDFDAVDHSI